VTTASPEATPTPQELAALSALTFELADPGTVLSHAAAAVPSVGPCHAAATYLFVEGSFQRIPQAAGTDIDRLVTESAGEGSVAIPGSAWGWAFRLHHGDAVQGCLVVGAADDPSRSHIDLLRSLASQTGTALACLTLQRRDERCAAQLAKARTDLADVHAQMQNRTRVHETIEAALRSADSAQAITDALHELTSLPAVLEDRFGNLRCWSGPDRPAMYPKPDPARRERQLAVLAARHGPMHQKDRVAILVVSRGETLGVLAIVDPRNRATQDDAFALQFACTLLGYELSHQRSLAQRELSVRRELVEDLLEGTDDDGAFARAEVLGHDLRQPHYVMVAHSSAPPDLLTACVSRAAAASHLSNLQSRVGRVEVLVTDGRPDPHAFHRRLSELLGRHTCAVGVGSRCELPSEIPKSLAEARRALNVRLHSARPSGASAYDELGFYRLIDAAEDAGAVRDFVREWIGALLDYDSAKSSELVFTLSEHLESGGNYDDSAEALHIHRSTLRYRLARISELTGYDLRDPDTRFNLHAATRCWRFLHSNGSGSRADS
jgi:hypothetical protein